MNGHIFETYVKKCLAPTLSAGDSAVMDNLSAHKVKGIRQAIEDKRPTSSTCRLILPT